MAGLAGERALVEGTPPYLLGPLKTWLYEVILGARFVETRTALQLKLRRTDIVEDRPATMKIILEGDELLEAIDATLDLHAWIRHDSSRKDMREWWADRLMKLKQTLTEGGSVWQLNDNLDGLTNRVNETVAQAVRTTMSDAKGDASTHLRKAWDAAYGFHPDPTVAYSEAVKAVEAITIPAVLSKDKDATLGKVLGEMRGTRAKWTLTIDDKAGQPASGDAVIELIALLWHGQRDRHSGPGMKLATPEVAQMAVHTAATLVQWFTSGNVHRS
jgi:hypothetical protein